ncbi:MAG: ATP-dependent DNA helicase RecG [Candidatus Omnitrophica bacterium]|nr:ATP-dependent DNA helicase RecG [Candidatus Omnitrophota bacterium]
MQEKSNHSKDMLQDSAQFVKGVGPRRIEMLNKLGISTIEDLLYYFPRRYEDRSNLKPISKCMAGNLETVKGEVVTTGLKRTRRGLNIFQIAVMDSTGIIYGVWFNQPYMKSRFKIGDQIIMSGKVDRFSNLQINSPEYEILADDEEDTIHTGRIVPIYPLTQYLNQRVFRTIIKTAIDHYAGHLREVLPEKLISKYGFQGIIEAVKNIHFPENFSTKEKSRKRLIFEEFFFLQLGIIIKRQEVKTLQGISHRLDGGLKETFLKIIPFKLTKAQNKVLKEIEADMASARPMNRLLQGDVGSGKTIVAIYALLLTVRNGFQGALMVPTEILAEQHYLSLSRLLEPIGVRVTLLLSGLTPKLKRQACKDIETGNANIIIGTHALIQEDIRFKKLGLAIIDEQHRFGVMQRAMLRDKGLNPDVLVMTATPIPRTLALTVYGDLDVSYLDELPPGRKEVKTYWVRENKRHGAYDFIRKHVRNGRQVYIIYPLVEESEKMDLKAATEMYEKLKSDVFPELKVGLIHGRMKSKDREEVMKGFKKGDIDILVSTTVIEVGIDVPNASIMLVEHAERFGLSQLHQLRGRVGRGEYESFCILVSNARTEEAVSRLKAMTSTQDGFRIAEEDLEIRGPGEFFGTRQHGLPELKIGNIITDMKIMETARSEAIEIIKSDPMLVFPEHRIIKKRFDKVFPAGLALIRA